MTKEQILELQKVHSEIYKKEIEPIYKDAQTKEEQLKSEFKASLDQYFDTIFKDKNGKTINVNDRLQLIEYQVKGIVNEQYFENWISEIAKERYRLQNIEFIETGKTRTVEFICTKRNVQFLFGTMLNNEKITVVKLKDGNPIKKEDTFCPKYCSELVVISNNP